MPEFNLLQGTLLPNPSIPEPQRITQEMIVPGAIKPRHFETNLCAVHRCKDAEMATIDGTVYPVCFAVDTNKLYCYTGIKFVSITLS